MLIKNTQAKNIQRSNIQGKQLQGKITQVQTVNANTINNSKQPSKMFLTAAFASAFMFVVISAVFAESSSPCLNTMAMQDKVVVDTSQQQSHTHNQSNLALCNRNDQQIGWLTWMFKQTQSYEFHYLDLLELLSRN